MVLRSALRAAALALVLAAIPAAEPPRLPAGGAATPSSAPKERDPWTRLQAALARRVLPDGTVAGLDEVDLLLWPSSTYLLEPERRAELEAGLDAFLAAGPRAGEASVLRRVLLQQKLWAAFDWAFARAQSASGEDARALRALARRLAEALVLAAPTGEELATLASNLEAAEREGGWPADPDADRTARPFLPRGLGDEAGEWVVLEDPRGPGPLAAAHAAVFGGRSLFRVALRAQGGREAALALLADLPAAGIRCDDVACAPPPGGRGRPHLHLDPALRPPPAGTQVALVRQALAFDDRGQLVATPLVLGVQVRAFLATPEDTSAVPWDPPAGWPWQARAELVLVPSLLLAGEHGGLSAIAPDEPGFRLLGAHGDQVEELAHHPGPRRALLDSCVACHGAVGWPSVNVYTGFASGPGTQLDAPLASLPRGLAPGNGAGNAARALAFKRARADWGALWAWIESAAGR